MFYINLSEYEYPDSEDESEQKFPKHFSLIRNEDNQGYI